MPQQPDRVPVDPARSVDSARLVRRAGLAVPALLGVLGACAVALAVLPTTSEDFKEPGTQARTVEPPEPWMVQEPVLSFSQGCQLCHAGFQPPETTVLPARWRGSLHAHSMRDPIFQAAMTIATQDAPGSAETCIRCHAPRAWLEGRATPPTGNPDGSTLFPSDIDEGVNCSACHRSVDFDAHPAPNEPFATDDATIRAVLASNGLLPAEPGNANLIIDPMDVRRGPFDFIANNEPEPPHLWAHSPHHRSADLCGACHDVSNPLFTRVGGPTPAPTDTYVLNFFNTPHTLPLSDQSKYNKVPEQRTYSEWKNSAFATTPGGLFIPDDVNPVLNRFGGNQLLVSTCQDCHMPTVTGQACDIFEPPVRNDLKLHSFVGANVFALDLLLHLYGPNGTADFDDYTVAMLERARTETEVMVSKATDTTLTQFAGELTARVINQCGHKLLTGMPEGRRIWLNVRFFNGSTLIAERGGYDLVTADLNTAGTKVYEQLLGLDETMAQQTGDPVGPSFNLVLVNKVFKDNRIPPRGFSNAAFEAVQAGHVGYQYADGQHWDDTRFCIPPGATRAQVRLLYQTSSKEYIEFLRDENTTDGKGQLLYDAWNAVGRSTPVVMDDVTIPLTSFVTGDVTGDGLVSFDDITRVLANFGSSGLGAASGDANCDGLVSFDDITTVLSNFGSSI